MKVLLLTSPAPSKKEQGFYLTEKRFPLGLAYLAAALRTNNIPVEIVDLYARARPVDFAAYDFIGIYANTICFKRGTLPLLEAIQASNFTGKIAMGGPHASVRPETIPDFVDYVVQGEGEEVIVGLVRGEYKKRIIKAPRIKDLDSVQRPAYDLLVANECDYNLTITEYPAAKKAFTYSSSRGCTFQCTFCSSKNIFDRIWTGHSPQRMVQDIEFLIESYGVDGIYFREDNFTINIKRVREFCQLVIKKELQFAWKCETRVDISFDDLKLMYDSGLKAVYVGFESGSERMLKLLKKQIQVEKSRQFVANCHQLGIAIYGSFVVGLPMEEPEDIRLTEKFIAESKLEQVGRQKYVALPGSELYEEFIKNPDLALIKGTIIIR